MLVRLEGHTGRSLQNGGKTMEYELKSGLADLVRAEKECDVYCPICHKVLHVMPGDVIKRCCGKTMEVLD